MSESRLQISSNGRNVPFFPGPVLSSADNAWSGYYLEESVGPAEPVSSHSWSKTTLLSVTEGEGSLNWKHRGVWRTNTLRRGIVSIIRRDAEIQSAVPNNCLPMMILQLDNAKLGHMAPDSIMAIDRYLDAAQVADDERLGQLMVIMRDEVKEGCPSGRLFGESISLALLAYLAAKYAPTANSNNRAAKLSAAQQICVADYIRANLTDNISVAELARLVQMSPSHFSRVFSAAFGVTPYRFVMNERIEGAKDMLASTKLSASEISSAYGFASQSHFTKVFRQFTGVTPKQYKAGV